MQITHEEARKLIQFNADKALSSHEKITLSAHLSDCTECRVYAEDIREVESILLPVMNRNWNDQPLPFSISTIITKRYSKLRTNTLLTTRTAMVGVVFIMFFFSVWQFTLSIGQTPDQKPVGALPVPTPAMESTSTKMTFPNCQEKLYLVKGNDTLASIAYQFSVSTEEIMTANNMKTETVRRGMELIIPICNSTPTGTVKPATFTTTYTPSINLTTFTPDG